MVSWNLIHNQAPSYSYEIRLVLKQISGAKHEYMNIPQPPLPQLKLLQQHCKILISFSNFWRIIYFTKYLKLCIFDHLNREHIPCDMNKYNCLKQIKVRQMLNQYACSVSCFVARKMFISNKLLEISQVTIFLF